MSARYTPVDELFLWYLARPAEPVLVGILRLVRTTRGVSLEYAESWIARGFALSEDLPLGRGERIATEKDTAAGAVDDARPDRWGERVIRVLDKPARLSLLEFLYFAGDDRFGALGVSTSRDEYLPRRRGPLPTLGDAPAIARLVEKVLANEPVPPAERRLIAPGASMGGARPKALVEIDGESWIVKFGMGEAIDSPLVEHAAMTLASRAGIRVARTRPVRVLDGHAVAIERFDRTRSGGRMHAISAWVALRATGERMGYPELSQLLRRRGAVAKRRYVDQMHELFRRMVFNILIDNTDDHEKNHALLVNDAQQLELSPAYDVLPSGQALGTQQMRVGAFEADSTLENALSMSTSFGLREKEARAEAGRVMEVIEGWKKHFAGEGVRAGDIDSLTDQIDRPFLRDQRRRRPHP